VPVDLIRRAVVTAALLRYPFTSLPLDELEGPPTPGLPAHARGKAAFVQMVLDLEHAPAVLSGR
jgi:hypothetical protein